MSSAHGGGSTEEGREGDILRPLNELKDFNELFEAANQVLVVPEEISEITRDLCSKSAKMIWQEGGAWKVTNPAGPALSRLKEDVDELCKKAFAGGMAQAEQRASRMMRKDDDKLQRLLQNLRSSQQSQNQRSSALPQSDGRASASAATSRQEQPPNQNAHMAQQSQNLRSSAVPPLDGRASASAATSRQEQPPNQNALAQQSSQGAPQQADDSDPPPWLVPAPTEAQGDAEGRSAEDEWSGHWSQGWDDNQDGWNAGKTWRWSSWEDGRDAHGKDSRWHRGQRDGWRWGESGWSGSHGRSWHDDRDSSKDA